MNHFLFLLLLFLLFGLDPPGFFFFWGGGEGTWEDSLRLLRILLKSVA